MPHGTTENMGMVLAHALPRRKGFRRCCIRISDANPVGDCVLDFRHQAMQQVQLATALHIDLFQHRQNGGAGSRCRGLAQEYGIRGGAGKAFDDA